MNDLTAFDFSPTYKSLSDNVISDFYVPALSSSIIYRRVSAYFSSAILRKYSIGLFHLAKNSGKIQFIFSHQLSHEDYLLMQQGYIEKTKLSDDLLSRLSDLEDSKSISNLAFLIANGVVDIKIAFTMSGIFHDKFGIFIDNNNNKLYFRGSNNETDFSVTSNYESFETTCSWNADVRELIKIDNAISSFDLLWNNNYKQAIVCDIPKCVKDRLIEFNKSKLDSDTNGKYRNSLVLDLKSSEMIAEGDFSVIDRLIDNYDFKINIQVYVNSIEKDTVRFKTDISYLQMEAIIANLENIGKECRFLFFTSDELRNYIISKNIFIQNRFKLATLIKSRDSLIQDKFMSYSQIVNDEIERTLRLPQMWDSFHMTSLRRGGVFSVPGSGKTSVILSSFAYLSSPKINEVKQLIVFGPLSSFDSWKTEFALTFGSKKALHVLDTHSSDFMTGKEKYKALKFDSDDKNLILINYESLPSLAKTDVFRHLISSRTMLVFDEVHKIKSVNGQRSSAALGLVLNAKYRYVMSGTPLPNSYSDIFVLLNLLFKEEYNQLFTFNLDDLNIADSNSELQSVVNQSIFPLYCRTTKNDLLIPKANPDDISSGRVNANESELALLKAVHRAYHGNSLLLYIRLLQASTNPDLLSKDLKSEDINQFFGVDEEVEPIITNQSFKNSLITHKRDVFSSIGPNFKVNTSKFQRGIEIIKKLVNQNKQVIVWAVFVDTLNKISQELDVHGISNQVICGSVPLKTREEIIRDFKERVFSVIIANPHTIAESISLHSVCHDAVYFEFTFNLTHMLQSRDRIHRLGLADNQETQYFYLFLDTQDSPYFSIDIKTYDRLKQKETRMLEAIEGNSLSSLHENTEEDLLAIMSLKI
jgi:SNF2 family DNA or RNA helicase